MTVRHARAGIDDRWHKSVKLPDGSTKQERSSVYGKVTRWRVRWVVDGQEKTKSFARKPDAQEHLKAVLSDLHNPAPTRCEDSFQVVADRWIDTKSHKKPSTLAGYRSILNNIVLPQWSEVPIVNIDYESYSTWLGHLAKTGSQRGGPLEVSPS